MKYRFVAISQGGETPDKVLVKHDHKWLSPKFAARIICAMHDYLTEQLSYSADEVDELIAQCRLSKVETVVKRLEE